MKWCIRSNVRLMRDIMARSGGFRGGDGMNELLRDVGGIDAFGKIGPAYAG